MRWDIGQGVTMNKKRSGSGSGSAGAVHSTTSTLIPGDSWRVPMEGCLGRMVVAMGLREKERDSRGRDGEVSEEIER